MIKCDFCNCDLEATRAHTVQCPPLSVVFECKDLVLGFTSPDNWAACDFCFTLLLCKDYVRLANVAIGDLVPEETAAHDQIAAMLVSQYVKMSILQ